MCDSDGLFVGVSVGLLMLLFRGGLVFIFSVCSFVSKNSGETIDNYLIQLMQLVSIFFLCLYSHFVFKLALLFILWLRICLRNFC